MAYIDPVVFQNEGLMQEAVGKNIICDDGTSHIVINVCPSLRFKDKCLINETDPDAESGRFVHYLSLVSQVMGKGVPSKEAMVAASKVWESMYYREMDPNKKISGWKQHKSGVITPN